MVRKVTPGGGSEHGPHWGAALPVAVAMIMAAKSINAMDGVGSPPHLTG